LLNGRPLTVKRRFVNLQIVTDIQGVGVPFGRNNRSSIVPNDAACRKYGIFAGKEFVGEHSRVGPRRKDGVGHNQAKE
jgi:hypothetical protein